LNPGRAPATVLQLAEARTAIAQGRLADALVHLDFPTASVVPADSAELAAAELLRGNVWYERGGYATARAHYERALKHFSEAGESGAPSAAGADAAASNLRLAEFGVARQEQRATEAAGLQLLLGCVLLAVAIHIVWLVWLSRRRPERTAE